MGVTTMTGQSIMDPTSAYLLESLGYIHVHVIGIVILKNISFPHSLHLPTNPTPKKQIGVDHEGRGGANEENTAQENNNDGSLSNNQIVRLWDQIQQVNIIQIQTIQVVDSILL